MLSILKFIVKKYGNKEYREGTAQINELFAREFKLEISKRYAICLPGRGSFFETRLLLRIGIVIPNTLVSEVWY
jgi:hypothetical protein